MKNRLLYLIVGLCIVSIAMCVSIVMNQKQTAFFDFNEVYNNCNLKVKLENDLKTVGSQRQAELDSLKMELTILSQAIESNTASNDQVQEFEDLKSRFLMFSQRYEEENIRLKDTYYSQIREEINEKAEIFAKENGYDYLFAAMGDGTIMYANPDEEVTEQFKSFLDKQ